MMTCSICKEFDLKEKICLAFNIKIKGLEHNKANVCQCFKVCKREAKKRGQYAKIQDNINLK